MLGESAVVLRRVDIPQHALIVHLDVENRRLVRAHHGLGADGRVGPAQFVEDLAPEDHRVAMAATMAGPRNRYMRRREGAR